MSDHQSPIETEIAIVGAGPIGIACSVLWKARSASEGRVASGKHGAIVFEKGSVGDTVRRFPNDMRFHSTSDRLGMPFVPLVTRDSQPTRQEMLKYMNAVARVSGVDVRCHSEVVSLKPLSSGASSAGRRFALRVKNGVSGDYEVHSNYVILATGYFDNPNMLGVEGEDLPHVSHFYQESFAHTRSQVVIIGGGNSACEIALELFRAGAKVTMVHRRADFSPTLKYWIRPDLENRIAAGEISRYPETVVKRITSQSVFLEATGTGKLIKLPADAVYAFTGYTPHLNLLRQVGGAIDESTLVPVHSHETCESSVPGVFISGSLVAGRRINQIFIENGYVHAERIVAAIESR